MKEFIDKTPEKQGTPFNRATAMAMQGFVGAVIEQNADGSITETNDYGEIKTTVFLANGDIQEIFEGEKIIVKTIKFNDDGSILEVLS